MSEMLLEKLDLFRDRVRLGSIRIEKEQYPIYTFFIGFFVEKVTDIEDLFDFFELTFILTKEKKISGLIFKELLSLVYTLPFEIKKINKMLDEFNQPDSDLNIIQQIQSFFNNSQRKLQPKNHGISDGTLVLQQQRSYTDEIQYDSRQQDRKKREAQDEAFARKIYEEEEAKKNINEQQTNCEICYCDLYEQECISLDQCFHVFHKACLIQTFKVAISSNNFPLRCPNDDCKCEVTEVDVKQALSKDLFQKYQSHTLKSYAQLHGDSISWCPTANCGYMFFFEKDDNERFECLQCKKEYCLNCRVEWHKDMTCKQYKISSTMSEDDEKFMTFVKGKKFKQCPKCKFWVQKNEGCDHMTCKCKFQFCYKCGGIYMKCECVEQARQEMQRRRRQQQQRRLKKEEKKRKMEQKIKTKAPSSRPKRR